ncbi:hypothetical protein VB773_08495 [Haloarculaceae archaeon H-GB2-1]|nr:hypothetical protein [Haloarculaceae archaeon H-GB1-1]MEA5386096.1 hypothetical protein [Haloarculaceae archaeon H-GB11]MEA5407602.1 hypothetical protein [Haloarculaceae archaeon H-GB2-1]
MPETLPVNINRETLHSVDVPDAFETTGSFDVDLRNHGEALHVHLHLDDALSEVATIDASNHYVDREGDRRVRVTINGDATPPVHGKLKVASAYGAQTRYVDVDYVPPDRDKHEVQVDESLAQPSPRHQPQRQQRPVWQRPELLVMLLGIVAIVVALVATLVIESTAVLLGSLAVLGGVVVAMYVLFQE